MAIKEDFIKLLTTDTAILKINFDFDGFLVFPEAYHRDIASVVNNGRISIKVTTSMNEGAGATYFPTYREFWVPPTFKTSSDRDASLLIHEATHAHMDFRKIGAIALERSEAIAYLAEAVYREARGLPPITGEGNFLRAQCHTTAKMILKGTYKVPKMNVSSLLGTLKNEPHYMKLAALQGPLMTYNGLR